MRPQPPLREAERENWDFFLSIPEYDRRLLKTNTIKGSMVMQPLVRVFRRLRGLW